jgi:hypothetical protein
MDMSPFDQEKSFFQEGFRLMAHCPLCQTRYQPNLAKVIAEKEDAYLLHVPCAKCHSAVVALIVTNMFGVNSVGVLTDLTSEEVLPAQHQLVDADDVLELYQAAKSKTLSSLLFT